VLPSAAAVGACLRLLGVGVFLLRGVVVLLVGVVLLAALLWLTAIVPVLLALDFVVDLFEVFVCCVAYSPSQVKRKATSA
jgi:hypothetical protein